MLEEAIEAIDTTDVPPVTLRDMVLDAVVGVGFPTIGIAIIAERQGLAFFDGKGTRWIRDKLAALSEEKLQALYTNLKVAQHGS
jgi:hypothetical protein